MKKLKRDISNNVIGGVCGGIGNYLEFDPTILRVLWAIFGFCGVGIIAYIIAWILIPLEK